MDFMQCCYECFNVIASVLHVSNVLTVNFWIRSEISANQKL